MVLVIVSLSACGSGDNETNSTNPTAQELAIELIADYAQDGIVEPTIQNYEDAGVIGVNSTNLAQINAEIRDLSHDDVDSKDEIQAIFDDLNISLLVAPSLSDAPAQSYVKDLLIPTLTFLNSTDSIITSCRVNALPEGLNISVSPDGSSCLIMGTPTIIQQATLYTVTASNTEGDATATVSISVININTGSGGAGSKKILLKGVVQKGLFTKLNVNAYLIDDSNGKKGSALPVVVNNQEYFVQLDPSKTVLVEANGTFTNEVDGKPVNVDSPLKVLVGVGNQNVIANINLLTTLVSDRVINHLAGPLSSLDSILNQQNPVNALAGLQQAVNASSPLSFNELVQQEESVVSAMFGLSQGAELDQLDYRNIKAGMGVTDPNVQLLLLSAGIMETIQGDNLFEGGFDKIARDVSAISSNATELDTVVPALGVLNGLDARGVYSEVVSNSNYGYLPPLSFDGAPVLSCLASRSCSWGIPQESATIAVSSRATYEAEGKIKLLVTLGKPSSSTVKLHIYSESDTAIDGADYLGVDEIVTFVAGNTSTAVYLDLVVDHDIEPDEIIKLSIESLTSSYSVDQSTISLSILDGAPAGFENQDSSKVLVDTLSVDFLYCESGGCSAIPPSKIEKIITNTNAIFGSQLVYDPNASIGLVDGKNLLIDVKVGIVCVDSLNCPVHSKDLLVDLYLVAKDSSNAQKDELSLGQFLYDKDETQGEQDASIVDLSGSAVNLLAKNATQNGWILEVEARLKSPIKSRSVAIPSLVPLPSIIVLKDGTEVTLHSVMGVSNPSSVGCQNGQVGILGLYGLPSNYHVPFGDENSEISAFGNFCVDLDLQDPMVNPAVAVDGQLEVPFGVKLPRGMAWRAVSLNAGLPIMSPFLQLLSPNFPYYLHYQGWPVEFKTNKAYVSFRGVEISYSDMRYVGDVGYSDQDPRSKKQLFSNDIYFSKVAGESGIIQLKPEGVDATFSVSSNPSSITYTAFPRAKVQWQGFTQEISKNHLQSTQINILNFVMEQSTECIESGCASDVPQTWQVSSLNAKLDGDGFLLGNAINKTVNQETVFGALKNGGFAWSRPDDFISQQEMKLAMPGFVIPATNRVSDYLIAHLSERPQENEGKSIDRYPLGTDSFIDGNYDPVGLSVGPEIYRDEVDGSPQVGNGQDLSAFDNKLAINNGVDAPFNLTSSIGVKYVLRNSGLTGVFNVAASSLDSNANFYSYPLSLSRFAVRATDNKLDSHTWIDGHLTLKGDAGGSDGLDIWFNNLEINCAARLGNVDLISEACDGSDNNGNNIIDENCSPRLFSWKADTDIFAAKFDGTDEALACASGDQKLILDQQLHFKALNKPVVFQTAWSATGKLLEQTSGQLPKYRFDKSDEGKGFPIKTREAKLGVGQIGNEIDNRYGWLEFGKTKIGVSFWNAFDADLQLANRSQGLDIVAEPTVVLNTNSLKGFKDSLNLAEGIVKSNGQIQKLLTKQEVVDGAASQYDIGAVYQWGNTGFGFELPVYYQPHQLDSGESDEDAQGRQSRFLGRTLSKDLFVMDANAGINFVEPERTKLSFGASADFERLGNINFQIDISDPDSAAQVDDLLISLSIINDPILEPALKQFLDQVNIVNRYANRGLDEVVREGLNQTIQAITSQTVIDPFVVVSDALAQARSGPQQIITVIADEIKGPLQNQLSSLEIQLLNEVTAIENNVTQTPALPKELVFEQLNKVTAILESVVAQVNDIKDTINQTVDEAKLIVLNAKTELSKVTSAVNEIKSIVRQGVSFKDNVCNGGLNISTGNTGYLDKITIRFAKVRNLAETIKGTDEIFDALEDLVNDSEQLRRINMAKRRIKDAVTELLGFVNTADKAIRDTVCDEAKIADVLSKSEDVTRRIEEGVIRADGSLQNIITKIQDFSTSLHSVLADEVTKPLNSIFEAISVARQAVEDTNISASDLLGKVDCIVSKSISNNICTNPPSNNLSSTKAVIKSVFLNANTRVDTEITKIQNDLVASLRSILPGAYMSPVQLRETLVTEIMRSGPIKEMRTLMDKHFSEISRTTNNIVLQYADQLNLVIKNAIAAVTGPINDALAEATSAVREMSLKSIGVDGFAVIAGNELERAHIGAEWAMGEGDDATEFRAALDAESWSVKHEQDGNNTPTKCASGDASSLLDVTISAYGLPINILSSDIELEEVFLGFTLQSNRDSYPALTPIGVFGGVSTMGQIVFTDAKVIDPAFVAGLGKLQTYIGARAAASFSSLEAEVAFLVGKVCPGNTALTKLDPDVAKFLPSMPPEGFLGAYLRGGATIPIVNPGSCFLNLGVSADFGTWIFVGEPTTIGGLIGGGAVGEVMCIAAIKGKVRVAGSVNTDGGLKLAGDAWGAAGLGICEPETWTNIAKSRDDSWCGTGDIETGAVFENGSWEISVPTPDAIF